MDAIALAEWSESIDLAVSRWRDRRLALRRRRGCSRPRGMQLPRLFCSRLRVERLSRDPRTSLDELLPLAERLLELPLGEVTDEIVQLPLDLDALEDEHDLLVTEVHGVAIEDSRVEIEGRAPLQELLRPLVRIGFQSGDDRDALHAA